MNAAPEWWSTCSAISTSLCCVLHSRPAATDAARLNANEVGGAHSISIRFTARCTNEWNFSTPSLDMRATILAMLVALLSGCVSVSGTIYVPTNTSDRVQGESCAGPYAYFYRELGEGITLSVEAGWSQARQTVAINIQGYIERGKTVQFLDKRIVVTSASSRRDTTVEIKGWAFPIAGRRGESARSETFPVDAILEGKGRNAELADKRTPYANADQFFSVPFAITVDAIRDPLEKFEVLLPSIVANGARVEFQPIAFRPQKYSKLVGLCG